MMRVRVKLPGFCMNRTVVHVRPRGSPCQPYKKTLSLIKSDDNKSEFSSKNSIEMNYNSDESRPDSDTSNRVMVVVDQSLEAKGALQWALTHTVQTQDTIILLYVTKPSQLCENTNQRAYELVNSMKSMCQTKRPGVQVEIAVQEGKEKGHVIVEAAKQRKVSLLVLGQRKRSIMWHLRRIWSGKKSRGRVVEHCIQNAKCMTIAVRRKSRKYGGYLITTKRHKDFWLLA
ncbi:PREDICTED: uncharacterized protein LOC109218296 [Nicotiana attenuata]|uniref:UspA domain-containing protein n=1 Tax=Nicotiana attenuata TaxID=49451 RepID=A0A1J6KA82_NICAT|nr:PREDICTED: uncharacterized protein LOC109218296 [Nicotiana attenuata]OIT21896.1 hypothetical protein A4A49_39463 [Nicotiana attenuata]